MGADGRIVNTSSAVLVDMRCYTCGRHVDRLTPWRGHETCLERDESLLVNISIENYEERGA